MLPIRGLMLTAVFFVAFEVRAADEQPGDAKASENLLDNSSFEEGAGPDGAPGGWSMWTDNETGYRCEEASEGRTGKKCLKIEGAGTRCVVFAKSVPIDRNKRYALRGWAKFEGEPGGRALVLFHYFDQGKWLGLPDSIGVTSKNEDWQLLTKTDRLQEVPAASTIWVSCTLEGKGVAWFDDVELVAYDRDKLPDDFESKYGASNRAAELAVLDRRVGVWETQTTIEPGVWVADGLTSEGVETVEWQLGNQFLRSKHEQQPGNAESLVLETFDGQNGDFRLWYFDSKGVFPRGEYMGHWDDEASKLSYEGVDSSGVTTKSVQRHVDKDRIETDAVWRDKDDRILMELKKVALRRK